MDINGFSARIRYSFNKLTRGSRSDVEDCIQDVLLSYLEKGVGQTVDQAVIDYLRKDTGRKGSDSYLIRCEITHRYLEYDKLNHAYNDKEYCENQDLLDELIKYARPRISRVVQSITAGNNSTETSKIIGTHPSRVTQHLNDINDKMDFIKLLPKETRIWVIENVF